MNVLFNAKAPKVTPVTTVGVPAEVGPDDWKYASLDYVRPKCTPFIRSVLAQAPIEDQHKHVLVDLKLQWLTPGMYSCLPGWHLDGPGNPLHQSKPELHHLFILGEYPGCETEFIDGALVLDVNQKETHENIVAKIPHNVRTRGISQGVFNTFTRFDFHRGVEVDRPMLRLLLRVTESDTIEPRNKPHRPAFGAVERHAAVVERKTR